MGIVFVFTMFDFMCYMLNFRDRSYSKKRLWSSFFWRVMTKRLFGLIFLVFSFLKDRLDDYNDDYRDAQPPFQVRFSLDFMVL